MIVDTQKRIVSMGSCDMVASLKLTRQKDTVQSRVIRVAKSITVMPNTRTLVPIKFSKPLRNDRDYRFQPQYAKLSTWLAMHGIFPESILDHNTSVTAFYNNSDTKVKIPASAYIGEALEWDYNDRATPEDPMVAHCYFSLAQVIPSLSVALNAGLTALQLTSAFSNPNTNVARPVVPMTSTVTSTDIFSLLPPADPGDGDPKKFRSDAIHVNMDDNITQHQIAEIKSTLQKYESLWEDRIGCIIEPEEDWLTIPLKEGANIESKGRFRVSKKDEAKIDQTFDPMHQD